MRYLFLVIVIFQLTACSTKPKTNHLFSTNSDASGTIHFQLNYFGEQGTTERAEAKPRKQKREKGPKGGAPKGQRSSRENSDNDAPVPSYRGLTEEHQLTALLEQELDQRKLCLNGYQIIEQRPTQNGLVIVGKC